MATPRWRGRAFAANGSKAADCLNEKQTERLRRQLLRIAGHVRILGKERTADKSDIRELAIQLNYSGRRFDKCPKPLWHLWRAIVFHQDDYTCVYCGRSTSEVHKLEGRGLRFELDHSTPRAGLGDESDDFDEKNIVTACRSCNVMKGQMDKERFERELLSLASAVQEKYMSRPNKRSRSSMRRQANTFP